MKEPVITVGFTVDSVVAVAYAKGQFTVKMVNPKNEYDKIKIGVPEFDLVNHFRPGSKYMVKFIPVD